jgi:hypothetical protein
MGLNYRYLLYFKRERLWDVLYALAGISNSEGFEHTTVHFSDHDQVLPLTTSFGKPNEIMHDDPAFEFALSLYFEQDPAILAYLHDRGDSEYGRSPPEETADKRVAIGFIYLSVYTDLSKHDAFKEPTNLVLFDFGTTGTRMSMLFEDSTSIRDTFIQLLGRYDGLIGILDREVDYGELFWFEGKSYQPYEKSVLNVYTTPDEIEEMLRRGW